MASCRVTATWRSRAWAWRSSSFSRCSSRARAYSSASIASALAQHAGLLAGAGRDRTNSVTSSTRWMIHATCPSGPSTGVLIGDHQRSSNAPGRPATGMSYFCTAIVSGSFERSTRCREAPRFRTPSASGSAGLSGKASKRYRPTSSSRVRPVARR